jgi:PKHD-type hydroxylase
MLLTIPKVLTPAQVGHCLEQLSATDWVDGNETSGPMAARAKRNLQIPQDSPVTQTLGNLILDQLGRNPAFLSAALPQKVVPPLFNRYDPGMGFGAHVDNAIRYSPDGRRYRTDLSCTLFLSDPADYDGGELAVEGVFGTQGVKLAAGDMVLYPASSLHRVEPITRGSRWASVFWVQSMVRDDGQRRLLYDLDQAIISARTALSDDHPSLASLTSTYHNLVRMWAEA